MTILLVSSILPVAAIFAWLYCRDRLREPPTVVLVTLGLGVLIAVPAVVLEQVVGWMGVRAGLMHPEGPRTVVHAWFNAFVVAALVEELLKFAVLWWYAARHDAFDEPMDGVVYGAAASLGFAGIENVLYVLGPAWSAEGGQGGEGASMLVAGVRAVTAVPMHAACGVILGACIGVARFTPARRRLWVALGLAGAIGLHGLYDFAAMGMGAMELQDSGIGVGVGVLGFVGSLAASVMVAVLALARLRRDQEVAMAAATGLPPVVPVRAPRLPMATCILAAASAGAIVVALAAGIATARGAQQAEPMSESAKTLLAVLGGASVLAGGALGLATVVTGIVSLSRQRRWRAATVAAMLVGGGVAGVVVLGAVVAVGQAAATGG